MKGVASSLCEVAFFIYLLDTTCFPVHCSEGLDSRGLLNIYWTNEQALSFSPSATFPGVCEHQWGDVLNSRGSVQRV